MIKQPKVVQTIANENKTAAEADPDHQLRRFVNFTNITRKDLEVKQKKEIEQLKGKVCNLKIKSLKQAIAMYQQQH